MTPHRRESLERQAANSPTGAAARILKLVTTPIRSDEPVPALAVPVPPGTTPKIGERKPLPVRVVACKDLGRCPTGHRCGEQLRECNAGMGVVKHLVECQTCEKYAAKAVTKGK